MITISYDIKSIDIPCNNVVGIACMMLARKQ